MNRLDSPWQYKPWWCQPWSILLTGLGLIAVTWGLTHWIWLTILVALPVSAWMGFFLLIWPAWVRQVWELEATTGQDEEQGDRA